MFKINRKKLFNFHLILACCTALPILVIALSGSLLVYVNLLEALANKVAYSRQIEKHKGEKMLSIREALTEFATTHPQHNILKITRNYFGDSYSISSEKDKVSVHFVLNPYSGAVLGPDYGLKTVKFLNDLHRSFMGRASDSKILQIIGKQAVALSALSLAAMVISGFILYFRHWIKNPIQRLKINARAKGYHFLSQIHSVIGTWLFLPVACIALSGLFWSYDFVRNGIYGIAGEPAGKPKKVKDERIISPADFANFDRALQQLTPLAASRIISIDFTMKKNNDIALTYRTWNNFRRYDGSLALFDRQTGALKSNRDYDEVKKTYDNRINVGRAVYNFHTGYMLGKYGRTLYFLFACGIVLFILSGFLMTYKRWKGKR